MLKQHQISKNDCIPACLANILHVPVESVPNFIIEHRPGSSDRYSFWEAVKNWLSFTFDLGIIGYSGKNIKRAFNDKYYIGVVKRKIGDRYIYHAVVCLNNDIVFDPGSPHPYNFTFNDIYAVYMLVNKRSERFVKCGKKSYIAVLF